jgi:hypothetical protein
MSWRTISKRTFLGLRQRWHKCGQGAAAAAARKKKLSALQDYRVNGLTFFAFAVESYGFLDQQAMDFIRHLCVAAANTGRVTYGSFLASVHREISIALVKGNHAIFRAGVQLYTRASGHARMPGYLVPTAEIEWLLLLGFLGFPFVASVPAVC